MVLWLVYLASVSVTWYKNWLVVRDWTRRPELFQLPKRETILFIFGWVLTIGSLIFVWYQHGLLICLVAALLHAAVSKATFKLYYRREIRYWVNWFMEQGKAPVSSNNSLDLGVDSILKSVVQNGLLQPEDEERVLKETALEFAEETVRRIVMSPGGRDLRM